MTANGTSTTSEEPLLIIAATTWYEIGELEDKIFRAARSKRKFEIVQSRIGPTESITAIPADLASRAHGILLRRHAIGAEELKHFPQLKCIVRTGVGYDKVDVAAAHAVGVTVHNTPEQVTYGTTEVADHALALALGLRRGIFLQHDHQRGPSPGWNTQDGPPSESFAAGVAEPLQGDLIQRPQNRVFGIIGLGRIGIAVALRAKAFGWKVIFYDPYVLNGTDKAIGVTRVFSIEELLRTADTISIHAVSTRETRGIINDTTLALVKPGAVLINTARGDIVDFDALERALRSGRLAAAGIDVIAGKEPPPEPLHPLLRAYRDREEWLQGRLVITPHVAYYTQEAVYETQVKSAETIRDVLLDGLTETNRVFPEL